MDELTLIGTLDELKERLDDIASAVVHRHARSGVMRTSIGSEDSLVDAQQFVGPAAATTIAKIERPTAGIYLIRILISIAGSANADSGNVALKIGSKTVIARVPGNSVSTPYPPEIRATVPNDVDITAVTIGAATAGAVYTAAIIATRVE